VGALTNRISARLEAGAKVTVAPEARVPSEAKERMLELVRPVST